MTEEQQQRVIAGRYAVIRELGRGGMGVVWLADDATIGRQVAIKELLLPPGIPPDERQVFEDRVLREARTAGRLSDPGIVTVHDVLQEDGATFIVMELVEAPDLSELIKRNGPMPADQVLRIAEQMLSALEAAHAAGVVHRDVKPSNVIVAPNGRVKLTDFGIAQSTEDPRLTSTGMLMGSPTYISPERLLGHEAVPASDLWALGATLYFASEGYGAYDRSTTAASIQAIMNERAQLRVTQQGPLADLIMGLLNPDPNTRLTAQQARYLIEQARAQRPPTGPQAVLPGPPSGPQPVMQPPSGPQPVMQPPSGPQPYPPRGGTRALTSPSHKRQKIAVISVSGLVLVAAVVLVLVMTGAFGPSTSSKNSGSSSGDNNGWPPVQSSSSESEPESSASDEGSSRGSADSSGGASAHISHTDPRTYGPDGFISSKDMLDNLGNGCFVGSSGSDAKPTDCASPHDIEVFAHFSMGDDAYPPEAELSKGADDGCKDKASDLSVPYEVTAGALIPTKQEWDSSDHNAYCFVVKSGSGRMTGSVAGN